MAVKTKNGIVLRNPAEKAKRYSRQLKAGEVRETGKKLSNTDKAYRAGYLSARSDNSKAWKSRQEDLKKLRDKIPYFDRLPKDEQERFLKNYRNEKKK